MNVPMGNTSGAQANEFQFAGEQTDPTGLQYLRARYYDKATGTFVSRDPLSGLPGWGGHPHGYTGGNPTNLTDPSGLCRGPNIRCEVQDDIVSAGKDIVEATVGSVTSLSDILTPGTNWLIQQAQDSLQYLTGPIADALGDALDQIRTIGEYALRLAKACFATDLASTASCALALEHVTLGLGLMALGVGVVATMCGLGAAAAAIGAVPVTVAGCAIGIVAGAAIFTGGIAVTGAGTYELNQLQSGAH